MKIVLTPKEFYTLTGVVIPFVDRDESDLTDDEWETRETAALEAIRIRQEGPDRVPLWEFQPDLPEVTLQAIAQFSECDELANEAQQMLDDAAAQFTQAKAALGEMTPDADRESVDVDDLDVLFAKIDEVLEI